MTPAAASAAGVSLFFGLRGKHPIALLLVVCALASGCQLVKRDAPWIEQTTFLEMPLGQARQYAANWAAQEPTRRGWSTLAFTGSMRPTMKGGEVVLLRQPQLHEIYLPGELVVWCRGDIPICRGYGKPLHRVLGVRGNAIYIKGDGNVWADGWFSRGTVEWVVPTVIRIPRSQTR